MLDTPGHADFGEDTYRAPTAVDTALMVIDGAKGVADVLMPIRPIDRCVGDCMDL